jgi:8-oxo-dGTP pyrophosphatase MutT (NUDIX family)
MHRQSLLRRLEAYAQRYPDEQNTTSWCLEFVRENPACFDRELLEGHITGSAWLVDGSGTRVLLTHHRKLGRWLQLGGHSDGNPDTLAVALQEAREESGLALAALSGEIFDLDIHEIPTRGAEPAHYHFDVRFALQAVGDETFQISRESLDLAWVPLEELPQYSNEESVLRMARKWRECHR